MIKVAFFDINDTLIKHTKAQEIAIKKMALLLSKQNETEFINIWKKTAKRYWGLFEEDKLSFEQQRYQRVAAVWKYFKVKLTSRQIHHYADYYIAQYEQTLEVNKALLAYLKILLKNHIPAGIISNGYGPLQRSRLKVAGIESYFTKQLIFISEEIGIAKPDEKIFILAEKITKAPPSKIIFFGNDPTYDIEPAKKRGWQTSLVNI